VAFQDGVERPGIHARPHDLGQASSAGAGEGPPQGAAGGGGRLVEVVDEDGVSLLGAAEKILAELQA
jgi:hypothetical protein